MVGAPSANLGTVIRGANGLVQEVITNYQNVGETLTDGIDFGVSYLTKEYDWGKFDFELNATYVYNYAQRGLTGR